MEAALYYLFYIDPDFQKQNQHRDLIKEYFEAHYFSRKDFLLKFLKKGVTKKWNGRFKKVFCKKKASMMKSNLGEGIRGI